MKKLEKSKTLCIVVLIILICLLKPHPGLADVMGDPRIGGSGGNTVVAMYDSPLTVIETITDIGGGSYRYEYSFVNTDASPIWHLSVDTTFVTEGVTKFTEHDNVLWGEGTSPIAGVFPQFDSRNLNPNITHTTYTYTSTFVDADRAIQIVEVVSGFSFTATTYDPSPKLYVYETIASGYARTNGTGQVAAVGLTVSEVTNTASVAHAGLNQAVDQGDTVLLDGSASYDANGDELGYSWIFVSVPDGSAAALSDAGAVNPTFTADKPGAYEVGLVVNDWLLDSELAIVSIVAISISGQSASIDKLLEAAVNVNSLDPAELKNKNMKNTLTKKINAVIEKIDEGLYAEALDKLKNDVLKKTDGCAVNGEPDKNDWIKDCDAQDVVYPLIVEAIELLSQLV